MFDCCLLFWNNIRIIVKKKEKAYLKAESIKTLEKNIRHQKSHRHYPHTLPQYDQVGQGGGGRFFSTTITTCDPPYVFEF